MGRIDTFGHTRPYYENPHLIFQDDNWMYFFPRPEYTVVENVNAITLFILYLGIFFTIVKRHVKYLVYAIAILVLIALLHRIYVLRTDHKSGFPPFPKHNTRKIDPCEPKNPTVFDMRGNLPPEKQCEDPKFASSRTFLPANDPSMSDQSGFARWLFDGIRGCKTDPTACTGYI